MGLRRAASAASFYAPTYGTVLAWYHPAVLTPGTPTSWPDSGTNLYTQTVVNGTLTASATSFNGLPGAAYPATGSRYVGITAPTALTMLVALYINALPGYSAIGNLGAYKPDFYLVGVHPNIQAGASNIAFTDLTLSAGSYYVLAFVWDGVANTVSCYLNGTASTYNGSSVSAMTADTTLTIGADSALANGDYANVVYGETVFYSNALSSGTVASATTALRAYEGGI